MLLLAMSAHALDLHNVDINEWISYPDPAYCRMAAYVDSTGPITDGFYVDFFVDEPAPPDFGEWGDYWFYVDPPARRVIYMDGRVLPQVTADLYYLAGVGEVRMRGGTPTAPEAVNVYLTVPDSSSRWWDVIFNGGADISESNYSNNSAFEYTDCR